MRDALVLRCQPRHLGAGRGQLAVRRDDVEEPHHRERHQQHGQAGIPVGAGLSHAGTQLAPNVATVASTRMPHTDHQVCAATVSTAR